MDRVTFISSIIITSLLHTPVSQSPGNPDRPQSRRCPNPRTKTINKPPISDLGVEKKNPPQTPVMKILISGLTDELELAGTSTISALGQRKPALAKSSPKNSSSGCHHKSRSGRNHNPNSHRTHRDLYKQNSAKQPILTIPQTVGAEL